MDLMRTAVKKENKEREAGENKLRQAIFIKITKNI